MKQLIIVFIILASYFGIHFFVFQSAITLLGIKNPNWRMSLYFLGAFLALSFIGTIFLVHYTDNIIARKAYLFAGIWVGLMFNLALASLIAWLVLGAAKIAGVAPSSQAIAALAYCFAFVFSAWGVWNAYNPVVRNIQVQVAGLPEFWEGKTIVQLSDIHLGNVLRSNHMERLARKIDSLDPEMILLTGDVFDGVGSDLGEFILPLNHIAAPQGIYFINGNHETYLGVEKVAQALKKTKIQLMDDQIVEKQGLQVFGIGFPKREEQKNIGEVIEKNKAIISQKPTILLNHAPTGLKEAQAAGIALQLSGHTHNGQLFPLELITGLIFGKYDNGLQQQGDFFSYTSSGAGVWGPTMRTSSRSEIVAIELLAR